MGHVEDLCKNNYRGLRDSSVARSADCFPREPRFEFQNPRGSSQPFAISVPGDLTPSFGFCGQQTCTLYANKHSGKNTYEMK